jgi:lysozyme
MHKLVESIKRHEGYRDRVYLDSEGKLTCGYGHHLWVGSKVPLECSDAFFRQDIADAVSSYQTILPHLRHHLNTARARVIVEMVFNMGIQKVLQFRKMWEAIAVDDFGEASAQMVDSKWAEQVGARATELAEIMRHGKDKEDTL